jgi:predicted ATP-dependent endonuclease of OLD family
VIQVTDIEIRYFRSIYILRFAHFNEINTFVGENDVGKSNIIKAINLFFNGYTDHDTKLDFYQDFNAKRLQEVRKETIKGKQFIQVSMTISRGKDRFINSLPEKFRITKTWFRDSSSPTTKSSAIKDKSKKNIDIYINKYLSSVVFEYIPAIKDNNYYRYLVSKFKEVVIDEQRENKELKDALKSLNNSISNTGKALNDEFFNVSKIDTSIELPENLKDLLSAFQISTNKGEDKRNLEYRGSGIQSRFIPSILFYLSQHSSLHYIWGFEEPENCLEYKLAANLMRDILNKYSLNIQIFITSHSPAFFSSDNTKINVFRIYKENEDVKQYCCKNYNSWQRNTIEKINDDIGIMEIQREAQIKIEEKMEQISFLNFEIASLQKKLDNAEKPIVLTEGKWDEIILNTAWNKLYENMCPYRIISCEANSEYRSISGADFLLKCMETTRRDQQKCVGVFDYDDKGYDCFSKASNYRDPESDTLRIHKNEHAAIILLPKIAERENYCKHKTMVMEFMFPDDAIDKKVDGSGLEFDYIEIVEKLAPGGFEIGRRKSNELYHRKIIKGSKKHFVEKVVPGLAKEDFRNFIHFFNSLKRAFETLK